MQFDTIIVDTNNLCYKLLSDRHTKYVNSKKVYSELFRSVIEAVTQIKSTFGKLNCSTIMLFDNADSRQDLQDSFYNVSRKSIYPEYKVHRKKDNASLYQTIDLIKYYYLVSDNNHYCIQVPNLEADDLVKPILKSYVKPNEKVLLISNDSDWTRYLSDDVQMLDSLASQPSTKEDYAIKLGFPITEMNVVLFKSLFGDSADNIPQIIRKTEKNLELFHDLVTRKSYKTEFDIMNDAMVASEELFKKSELHEKLDPSNKKSLLRYDQFSINVKLTSSFPIDEKHLVASTCQGRNAIKLREAIEKSVGLLSVQKKFSFGLKRPRT